MLIEFFDNIPLWGAIVLTLVVVWVATETGFQAGRFQSKKTGFDGDSQISSMTGAHLGLLAFILAFSFGMAASNFEDRKQITLQESNAIETAYLRTTLIAEPQGKNIRALLRQYTTMRINVGDKNKETVILTDSVELQNQIWHEIENMASGGQFTVKHSLLVQAINDVFDLHEERVFVGLKKRIPSVIWIVLYAVLLLSMVGLGFHSGIKDSRIQVPGTVLALSFTIVLFLIADLDRPRTGLVKTDQSSFSELRERLK